VAGPDETIADMANTPAPPNPEQFEGTKLRRALLAVGKTPADMARACGVTRTAVDRYLKAETIGDVAWRTVRLALIKLGIDPKKVRPTDVDVEEQEQDLQPLVHDFTLSQLERLKKILKADEGPQKLLFSYIEGIERGTKLPSK
jgi:transcriptional regulator with XRE-family HTH domain